MPVIAKYRLIGKDPGLLALAFPTWKVLKGPIFFPFIPETKVVVISEDPKFSYYPDKQVIQIISTAPNAVDTKDGFLRILAKQGVKATDGQVRTLLNYYTDEEFWHAAKLAVILKSFPMIPRDGIGEDGYLMIRLFSVLFADFAATWRIYWKLRKTLSTVGIFCAVCDMMKKAERPEEADVGPRYRAILKKNRRYSALFDYGLNEYLTTDRADLELLGFFAMCSAHKEGPFPYFDETDDVGCKLAEAGDFSADAKDLEAAFRARYPTMFPANPPFSVHSMKALPRE